jgi:hypothetical protein
MPSPSPSRSTPSRRNPPVLTASQRLTYQVLLWSTIASVVLSWLPWADTITWPLRLLVTYVHEGWHALAALLTGGEVRAIEVVPQGSGSTLTQGGWGMVISSAGYLGATFTGIALLVLLRRGVTGNRLLALVAAAVGIVTLGALASPFTLAMGLALTAGLGVAAWRLPRRVADFCASFVGIQCGLNAFYDLRTLLALSVVGGTHTDAMNMQEMTLIPAVVWAALWTLASFVMLWRLLLRPMAMLR